MTSSDGPIVVGTDGSAPARAATRWAASLARELGRPVVLVHALGLIEHLPGADPVIAEDVRAQVHALLHGEWAAPLAEEGVVHRCVLEDGPPRLVLPRIAESTGASMIVVSSHGRGGAFTLLGSTSHALVQVAPVPVVVVPGVPRDVA